MRQVEVQQPDSTLDEGPHQYAQQLTESCMPRFKVAEKIVSCIQRLENGQNYVVLMWQQNSFSSCHYMMDNLWKLFTG